MQSHRFLATVALSCAAPLSAQSTFVSPAPASATVEGSQSNAFPWNSSIIGRYMQIHTDVVGTAMMVNKIAQRRNGASATSAGTRIVDMDLTMGESVPYNRYSYVFAANYIGTPVVAVPRQIVNIGPNTTAGSPAPFEMVIPLTTPFLYTGVNSLAWEVMQYSNTASGAFVTLDTEAGSAGTAATPLLTGAGCTATGQSTVMDLQIQHVERGGTYQFGAYVRYAPANAPTVLYLGTSNPNLPFPGLCGNLYTDLAAQIGSAVADANGDIRETGSATSSSYPYALWTFMLPNNLGSPTLYAQAHAFDAGRSDPVPICNSNGRSWVVPAPSTAVVAMASRLYNFQLQGAAYPNASPLTLMHGYSAVTEFTY